MFYQVGVKTASDTNWVANGVVYRNRKNAEISGADLASRWTLVRDWTVLELTTQQVKDRKLTIYEGPTVKGPNHRVQL